MPDPAIIVLLPGYAEPLGEGRFRAGGTVTLVKGPPHVLVDTGAPEQRAALLESLENAGVRPDEIDHVVLTHGHLDHVGNDNLFPGATFLLDTDVSRNGEYWTHDFAAGPYRIPGTPPGAAITVIATPGHTDHDLTVVVENAEGTTAIVGDLFEHEGDWRDESAWKRWSRNWEEQRRNRERILRMADFVVPGHGPRFRVPPEGRTSA